MTDSITANVVVSMPSQLFTLARSFKANANGKIYIGKIDTDPLNPANQIQVYIENENGTYVPVSQPLIINSGGYAVYNGQAVKFVTSKNYSMAIYDAFGVQQFYFSKVCPSGISVKDFGAIGDGDADDYDAIQSAINSGLSAIYFPEGTYFISSAIQLPARDIELFGLGRASKITGTAPQLIKYPSSTQGYQNIHSLMFIVGSGQTGIQMHKLWDANGKEEVQVTRCHFYSTSSGAKFITLQGIWSARIQDNEFYGGSRSNDSYGIMLLTDDNMSSSVMNIDISGNKMSLISYPVFYAGKTSTSGGRVEGLGINDNKTIGSKTGIRLGATLATVISDNMIHDCDVSAIELNGDFDFVINGNVELVGLSQAILLNGITESILERGVISGNKISAGNNRVGILIKNNGTAPRSLSITGNVIGRVASGSQTGTGIKIDSPAAINSVSICGNAFQHLDTAIDRGGQTGDVVIDGNAYTLVTNTGAGQQSTPFAKSITVTLVGGATSEVVTVDIPPNACSRRPQFAIAMGVGGSSAAMNIGYYDFDNSTSTQLKFRVVRMDGGALTPGGVIRLNIFANMF